VGSRQTHFSAQMIERERLTVEYRRGGGESGSESEEGEVGKKDKVRGTTSQTAVTGAADGAIFGVTERTFAHVTADKLSATC
jgi:hypothetical protein